MTLVDRLLGLWHEFGITVVVASHQADRVVRAADATVRLHGGLVAEVSGSGVRAGAPAPGAPAGRCPRPGRRAGAGPSGCPAAWGSRWSPSCTACQGAPRGCRS